MVGEREWSKLIKLMSSLLKDLYISVLYAPGPGVFYFTLKNLLSLLNLPSLNLGLTLEYV